MREMDDLDRPGRMGGPRSLYEPEETATGSGRRFIIRPTNRYPVHPIVIFRGWAALAFGRVSVNTPSSRLALIFS
jgi:hypothetical protein